MNNGCICCTGKLPRFKVVFCVTATARLVCTHGISICLFSTYMMPSESCTACKSQH